MEDRKPKGHGDFANLITGTWSDRELAQVAEEILELERQPGFARLMSLLDSRERFLVDRLVIAQPTPDNVRATDQTLGTIAGLRQSRQAIDSIIHESIKARERVEAAARVVDADRSNT